MLWRLLAYPLAIMMLLWRATCRLRIKGTPQDPRPKLRRNSQGYVLAALHAHLFGGLLINDEKKLWTMVSASSDGDMLIPSMHIRGVQVVRGSTRKKQTHAQPSIDKGGHRALKSLVEEVGRGGCAVFAVDGPRGPRGHVARGVAELSVTCDVPIIPISITASSCWVLTKTWDRFQIPKPFSTVTMTLGTPIFPHNHDVTVLRAQVATALVQLEPSS